MVFGCPVVPKKYTITTKNGKVNGNFTSQRGVIFIFLGVPPNQQGWLLNIPGSHHISFSNDGAFDEHFEGALSYNDRLFSDVLPPRTLHTTTPTTDTVSFIIHQLSASRFIPTRTGLQHTRRDE
jgi:hypothetical protein